MAAPETVLTAPELGNLTENQLIACRLYAMVDALNAAKETAYEAAGRIGQDKCDAAALNLIFEAAGRAGTAASLAHAAALKVGNAIRG